MSVDDQQQVVTVIALPVKLRCLPLTIVTSFAPRCQSSGARRAKLAANGLVRLVPARPTSADVQVAGRIPRALKASKKHQNVDAVSAPARVVRVVSRFHPPGCRYHAVVSTRLLRLEVIPSWFRKKVIGSIPSFCRMVRLCRRVRVICSRHIPSCPVAISHLYSFPLIITAS